MGIEEKLADNTKHEGIAAKTNSIWQAWKNLSWKGKMIAGLAVGASTLLTGGLSTVAGASFLQGAITTPITMTANIVVYKMVQKKNRMFVTSKGLLAEILFGSLMAPYGIAGYAGFNLLPSWTIKMAVGFGALIPFSYAMYFPIRHLLHNYTFKEFTANPDAAMSEALESLKQNFWKAYMKSLIYLPIPLGLYWHYTSNWSVPAQAQTQSLAGVGGRVFLKYNVDKDIKSDKKYSYSQPAYRMAA